MIITEEQKNILIENGISLTDDIDKLLLDLDSKITEVGFTKSYELNNLGLKLQKLYDAIYSQN